MLIASAMTRVAGAQVIDAAHNHLECLGLRAPGGQTFTQRIVDLETQFGFEPNVTVQKPVMMCAPAVKTGGGSDPLPPSPVPYMTCYRVSRGLPVKLTVTLTDQFGTGLYTVSSRKYVCAPTLRIVPSTTTSTTTTTTSTTGTTTTTRPGSPSGAFLVDEP